MRWGRAKYSGICYVRFFPPLGSHSWVKWLRFLSSCTFSHFSGPSIMHLWIKIGGTLEDLLKTHLSEHAWFSNTHLHTRRHLLLHSKNTHSHINTQMSIPQLDEHWHHQCTVYRMAFSPRVPCCSGLPGKEEAPPGSAPLGHSGLLAKA